MNWVDNFHLGRFLLIFLNNSSWYSWMKSWQPFWGVGISLWWFRSLTISWWVRSSLWRFIGCLLKVVIEILIFITITIRSIRGISSISIPVSVAWGSILMMHWTHHCLEWIAFDIIMIIIFVIPSYNSGFSSLWWFGSIHANKIRLVSKFLNKGLVVICFISNLQEIFLSIFTWT